MVDLRRGSLDHVYRALGDPTRRRILRTLARGDRTISELARPHDMTLAAVSKHIVVLERAGLVARTRIGRTRSIRLCTAPLRRASEWLGFYEHYWAEPLESLEALLASGVPARARQRDDDGR